MDFSQINKLTFESRALETFRLQYRENGVYRQFVQLLRRDPNQISQLRDIPFLPISFFKTHDIVCGDFVPEAVFESSGTTKTGNSKHLVKSLEVYRHSFLAGFRRFYGAPSDWCVLALLPSYLERGNSSLVYMAAELIRLSGHEKSGFYLDQHQQLHDTLTTLEAAGQRTILLGVTFALLDFSTRFPMSLKHTIVMETGGMKGRGRELTRAEVHARLSDRLGVEKIHSEYGMTELLSQAYSSGDGVFQTPPWMRILLRSAEDPFLLSDADGRPLQSGLVNVIDLANLHSCSFVATDDIGRLSGDGAFEILGRLDHSDMRGCSLLVV